MNEVAAKRPGDSRFEKRFLFSSDPALRERFINFFGDLRFGILLEEMDSAAGVVAYDHTDGFDKDLTIVTAACDRIELLCPLQSDRDLRILGQVNYVGRSSMEVGLQMESKTQRGWEAVANAFFIMVARREEGAFPVPPLRVEGEQEMRSWDEGRVRQGERRSQAKSHYLNKPPSAEESALLHSLLRETEQQSQKGVLMKDTHRQATILMHPQNRNIHNKVFGGYIMRLSFETAWSIAHIFSRRRPLFLAVDQFDFLKPVEIGSIVSFDGMVTFTGKTSYIIEVKAEVINPRNGTREITNISYFTFVAADAAGQPRPVPAVLPRSYDEGLKFIDGRRRYHMVKAKRETASDTTPDETSDTPEEGA
ncbi:hotdog domain-containing protein [Acanthopleuribacter pedis]|uniref:HotDog ACOT-type domain-containing protein n=1 Tax=Acanthopleuribacter pedis TaxID=442870 RepID=A0A8J7QEI2_9BACT|nr:hotdog domain-containing protein [Acanthopleuribacter pedis]MBO1322779.1 hypothetical protein [Acanthopleuribacter pedis]